MEKTIEQLLAYTTDEHPRMTDAQLAEAIICEVIDRDLPVPPDAMFRLNTALGVYAE